MIAKWNVAPEDASLVLYRRSASHDPLPCPHPRPGVELVSARTGEVVPVRCERSHCPACLPVRAVEIGRAIEMTKPEFFITVTRAGDDWATVHQRMTKARDRLRRRGIRVNWIYFVEPHSQLPSLHIHAWVWGLDLGQLLTMRAVLRDLEMGPRIHIDPAWRYSKHYPMKMVLNDGADGARFLQINGGRLFHASQGFWRDPTGRTLHGQRAAIRAAHPDRGSRGWFFRRI